MIIFKTLFFGVDLPGYASLVTIVLFLGGIQLIGLGVMGEYLGRLYMESKRRPVYLIDDPAESPKNKQKSATMNQDDHPETQHD